MALPASPEAPAKVRIGEALVEEGLITPAQLEEALAAQKGRGGYAPLGEVCARLGFCTRADVQQVLRKHRMRIRLGDLLANLGLVSPDEIETALARQKRRHAPLGQILLEMGVVTEAELLNALSIQLGVPRIVPDPGLLDRALVAGLSPAFLRRHVVIPAFRQDDVLTLVMADPLNEAAIRDLQKVFGCRIDPAIALPDEILAAIAACSGKAEFGPRMATANKDLVIGETRLRAGKGDGVVEIVNFLITSAILDGASDVHLEPQSGFLRVRFRIDGVLRHKTDLPGYLAAALASRVKVLCRLDITEKRRHQDGRIEARVLHHEVDLRVSTYATGQAESVVIRILHRQRGRMDLEALGFSPANESRLRDMLEHPSGVMLVTGPTGTGKTTTLYACLTEINRPDRKIITVEDPVEYTIPGVVQGHLDAKAGLGYPDFLRAMMRQDPDVLMIGEIRDRPAAEAVIQAALTGHKVLTTFHTEDTVGALLRMIDMGIEAFLISSTVISVVAQRLVRVLCTHCREPQAPAASILQAFQIRGGVDGLPMFRARGCVHCGASGYRGRTAIHEVLAVNEAIRECILARRPSSEIRRVARRHAGLVSLREDGFYKASKGVTSLEEVLRVAYHEEIDPGLRRTARELVSLCERAASVVPEGSEVG